MEIHLTGESANPKWQGPEGHAALWEYLLSRLAENSHLGVSKKQEGR